MFICLLGVLNNFPRYNNHDEHHYISTQLLPAVWTDCADEDHDHHCSYNHKYAGRYILVGDILSVVFLQHQAVKAQRTGRCAIGHNASCIAWRGAGTSCFPEK